jgi:predicted nucleic acid-binding protein
MYRKLKSSTSGVPNANKYLIVSARPAVTQTLMTVDTFGIQLVELTKEVVRAQCGDLTLQMKGVRAADALHVTTALLHDAELLLSADEDILKLDGELSTVTGKVLSLNPPAELTGDRAG